MNKGCEIQAELRKIFGNHEKFVIADIGACDGLSSVAYALLFPNAFIHAFEPRYDNINRMTKNFINANLMKRSEIHYCALGNHYGMVDFWKSDGKAGKESHWYYSSSVLKPKEHLKEHPWCRFKHDSAVMQRLDDMHIDHIDFAHIDVQGAEMMVLQGGERTFSKTRAFWIEVANMELYEGQPLRDDIVKYMEQLGCRIEKDTCGDKKYGDILFVR